jgi:AcrR family transcriptional regulator
VRADSLVQQLRLQRSETISHDVEVAAVRLFEERGFGDVTVEDIAAETGISVRTFYRYFDGKEGVLQRRIDRRGAALRLALSARSADEPPLRSLRIALQEVQAGEDEAFVRPWIAVIAATPSVVKGVLGAVEMKRQTVIRQFLGERLGVPSDALVPTMVAAAVGGVVQAAHSRWFSYGGDLGDTIASALEVLEQGMGAHAASWTKDLPADLWG